MTTVKFASQEKLKEIQSKIFLNMKESLTQQEILEHAVEIIDENIELILERISKGARKFNADDIEKLMKKASHWGEGTENISTEIDEILYGGTST